MAENNPDRIVVEVRKAADRVIEEKEVPEKGFRKWSLL